MPQSLSSGERQRLNLGKALAANPKLLLLDEPAQHLDIRQQMELLRLLRSLSGTVIASFHDINLAAAFADKILVVKEGKQLAFGKPDKILTNEAVSKAFSVVANRYTVSPTRGPSMFFTLSKSSVAQRLLRSSPRV